MIMASHSGGILHDQKKTGTQMGHFVVCFMMVGVAIAIPAVISLAYKDKAGSLPQKTNRHNDGKGYKHNESIISAN